MKFYRWLRRRIGGTYWFYSCGRACLYVAGDLVAVEPELTREQIKSLGDGRRLPPDLSVVSNDKTLRESLATAVRSHQLIGETPLMTVRRLARHAQGAEGEG